MASLKVSNLSFAYAQRPILQDVSFSAQSGDFIALVGPNGVGKSTLFRCILGFLNHYTGEIEVDGDNTTTLSRKELARRIAYIPQSSDQVFNYTVLELALMGLATRLPAFTNPSKADEEEVIGVLDELGIAHLAYQGCSEISGGEYQLVLLARALVQNAHILVMDEPTANLDYGNQYRVMNRIASLSHHHDFIVMMAAHDPNQVLLHATRALVLKAGHVIADGAPGVVMTEDLMSNLYDIEVHRHTVDDAGRSVEICIPAGLRGEK